MIVSIKKAFVLVAMALALLASIVGGTARLMASSTASVQHNANVHQSHVLALKRTPGCPPPPYPCWP